MLKEFTLMKLNLKFYNQHFDDMLRAAFKDTSYKFCCINVNETYLKHVDRTIYINVINDSVVLQKNHSHINSIDKDSNSYLGEKPRIIIKHDSVNEIVKTLYYFTSDEFSIEELRIDQNKIILTLKVCKTVIENNIKESVESKRIKSQFRIKDLEQALNFYQNGVIMDESNGSIAVANRENFFIKGYGFEFKREKAKVKAMLEYLERSAALYTLPSTFEGCYLDFKENAIDPRVFGMYDDDIYRNYPLQKYHDKLDMHWVTARSLLTNNEYLIPEQLCQYLRKEILNQYVYESSNGCAVGNSMTEASYYSILEVVERDIFMKFWFDHLCPKKIVFEEDDTSVNGKRLYFEALGYKLEFYYIANESNIPVVWCLITSMDNGNLIYSMTGLGCHLNVKHALDSSFYEAYKAFHDLMNLGEEQLRVKIENVSRKGYIRQVSDHIHYFASYSAKSLIDAKISNIDQIHLSELCKMTYVSVNVEDELSVLLHKLDPYYKDVLIVDQSNQYLEGFGLRCTKAFLIGASPLDFTSHFIRKINESEYRIRKKMNNIHPLA